MADRGGECLIDPEDFDISQILLIQAVFRGALVRKWMKEVKQSFEEAFVEIERNSTLKLEWKSDQLCQPRVVRKRDRKNEKNQKVKGEQSQIKNRELNDQDLKTTQNNYIVQDLAERDESVPKIPDTRVDSPKFNSVEIQTSFIDVSVKHMPNKSEKVTSESEKEENILEDLDTSWRDRVEPFIQNNFGKGQNVIEQDDDIPYNDELHLDLDVEEESLKSQRSQRSSQHSVRSPERHEGMQIHSARSGDEGRYGKTTNYENHGRFVSDKRRDGDSRSYRSSKSERSRSTSVKKHDHGGEIVHVCQRSRSEDQRSEVERKIPQRSPEDHENEDNSERRCNHSRRWMERNQYSDRSDKSTERSQKLNETERFSPRGQRSSTSQHSRSQRSKESEKESEGQLTHRSDQSESKKKHSHRSEGSLSQRSDRSEDRKSQRSQRSMNGEGQRLEKKEQIEKMHPQQSRASPVEFHATRRDSYNEENSRQGRPPLQDSTSLTNVTSVWDSFNSVRESHEVEMPKPLPQDATQLKELRKNIAMELLWVQQAIDSRKNYLKLKGKM